MTPFDRLLIAVCLIQEKPTRAQITCDLLTRHDRNMTYLQAGYCLNRFISRSILTIDDRKTMESELDSILDLHAIEEKQVETDAHQP